MFTPLRVTTTMLPSGVAEEVVAALQFYGATYTPHLTTATDVVVHGSSSSGGGGSAKWRLAVERGIPCVPLAWLQECIATGRRLPFPSNADSSTATAAAGDTTTSTTTTTTTTTITVADGTTVVASPAAALTSATEESSRGSSYEAARGGHDVEFKQQQQQEQRPRKRRREDGDGKLTDIDLSQGGFGHLTLGELCERVLGGQ